MNWWYNLVYYLQQSVNKVFKEHNRTASKYKQLISYDRLGTEKEQTLNLMLYEQYLRMDGPLLCTATDREWDSLFILCPPTTKSVVKTVNK